MDNFWRNILIGGVVAYFLFRKKKLPPLPTYEEEVEKQAIADEYMEEQECRVLLTSGILDKGIYKPGILPDDFCIQGVAHLTGQTFSFGDPFAEQQADEFTEKANEGNLLDSFDSVVIQLQNDTDEDTEFEIAEATDVEEIWDPIPAAPAVGDATGVGATSFSARWSSSGGATGYYLDVATDSGFTTFVAGYENLDVGNVTSSSVTGLTGGTTYYYRIRAYNTTGTSNDSGTTTVLLIPAAPVASAASNILGTSFTANWSVSTGATKYYIDVATDNAFTLLVTGYDNKDVGNVTNTNVIGLTAGVTYYYRIRAYNTSGASSSSNTINLTTAIFESTWKTNNVGVSNNDQIKLPLEATGTYDFEVDWGDGNSDTITAWDQAETTHTYLATGTYTVKIIGTINGWRFNNGGDRLKLLTIESWGNLLLGNNNGYFYGCSNLVINATDILDVSNITTFANAFTGCISLTTFDVSSWDISNVITFSNTFENCISLTTLNVSAWNISNVITFFHIFAGCTSLTTLDVSAWNVNNATNFNAAFFNCTSLTTLDVSAWNVSNVTDFSSTFENCILFTTLAVNNWNITNVTNMTNMFSGVTLTTVNYDAILIAWSALAVQVGVSFHAGGSKYTGGGAAAAAKAVLEGAPNNWNITDGGVV